MTAGRPRGTGKRSGARGERVRVKDARRRGPSSVRWLERQLSDPYVAEARRQGYRSRAAFKLMELDDRFGLLRPGMRLIDLGAAPGGWTQVAVERVHAGPGAGKRKGRVVAIDLLPMDPVPGATILSLDFLAADAPALIEEALGGAADAVLSDMATPATGHAPTDHLRVMALAEAAHEFARKVLAPGGAFVAKVLKGGAERGLLAALKRDFAEVRHAKPPSSRPESSEVYVVARGFRGT